MASKHEPKENQQPNEARDLQNRLQDVVENGAVTTDNGRHTIHCLTIIGQIEALCAGRG